MVPVSKIRGIQMPVVVYFPGYCRRSSCLKIWKVTDKLFKKTQIGHSKKMIREPRISGKVNTSGATSICFSLILNLSKQAFAYDRPSHAVELFEAKLPSELYCFESRSAQEQ